VEIIRVTVQELTEEARISIDSCHTILVEDLRNASGLSNISAKTLD
jgi:hypothetical protein